MGDIGENPAQKMNSLDDLADAPEDASSGLLSFSLTFYERPQMATALIALQDEAGLKVNLVLFAIWLGLSARGRIDQHRIDEAERAVRSIEVEVIEPLRVLRRRLKTVVAADIRSLRERIQAVEIDAEKAAQTRLAALAGPASDASAADRLADAQANLGLYLGSGTASGSHAAIIRRELQRLVRNQ
jgi:uncharacterized protein (TIGR02444 family)